LLRRWVSPSSMRRKNGKKLVIVREEAAKVKTLHVGDGTNDAPAMMAATVGLAIGQNSDFTAEAAGVVIIGLQSAVGGMVLSVNPLIPRSPVWSNGCFRSTPPKAIY
jgi:hypothetical protein